MSWLRLRLSHKLAAILLCVMVGVAIATATLVYFAFERTQDNARNASRAGLEELGLNLIVEMSRARSEEGANQLEKASLLAEEIARYFVLSLATEQSVSAAGPPLVQGDAGQSYSVEPTRSTDLFVPSGVELSDAVMADIMDSVALEAIFQALLPLDDDSLTFQPVALFFHSSEHVIRYYPPIGLQDILPPDFKIESDLALVGPDENPEHTSVWSLPYEDEAGQGYLITAMAPVYVNGVYRGRVGVDVSMEWLAGQVAAVKPTESGFAFYVDKTGELLATGGQGILSRNLPDNEALAAVFDAMSADNNGAARVLLDGQEYFVAYAGFGTIGGSFGVAAPISEITAEAGAISASIDEEGDRTILMLLAAIGGLFLFALVGAALVNRQVLLKPIEALVEGTRAVRQGQLDVSLEVKGQDEMAQLGNSFNLMASEVRVQREALEAEVAVRQEAEEGLKVAFGQLSEREEQYRAVFNAATDGIVVTDVDTGLLVAANPAFCSMHGYEDMVGMQPLQFIHPESHHLFEQFRGDLLAGKEFRCRARDVRLDGSSFDVDVIGRGFTYQGKFALLGVVRDVTEEVQAIQLLEDRVRDRTREIERRREVAEGLRDLLTVVNSGKNLEEILQAVVEQARGLLQSDASSILLPDESGQYLVTSARSGRLEEELIARLRIADSAVGVAFKRRTPVAVPDVATVYETAAPVAGVPVTAPVVEEAVGHLRITRLPLPSEPRQAERGQALGKTFRGFLAVPLATSEQSYGALSLNFHEPREFLEEEIALAMAFADQATLALENARLAEEVQASATQNERQRLARELHDAVTQTLFSTSLIAEAVPELWEKRPELARQKLLELGRLTRGALAEMRTLLIELRPAALTELSLAELLRQLAEATAGKTRLEVAVETEGQPAVALPGNVQTMLYRIAQEAMNNVVRHAQATNAVLSLTQSAGGVTLQIKDDGKGFNPGEIPGGHFGVGIMRERADAIGAELCVESEPGKGTLVTARWSSYDND